MHQFGNRLIAAIAVTLLVWAPSLGQAPHLTPRNILTSRYSIDDVERALIPAGEWRPLPTIVDRAAWEAIPEPVRSAHVAAAESLAGAEWESMTASLFLEFVRTGNRSNYQRVYFDRRERLATLVIAELIENKGRFLDDIVDGIWLISEETFWGIPAHLDLQTAGYGLPDDQEPVVDLFAAETGALLSWTLYLLDDRLDEVSPLVAPRIRDEVRRRILEPTRDRNDFWWMGFDPTVINNWTPWVGSNWLAALLLIETDPHERAYGIHKILRTLDLFMNSYADDGGCDEGPGYWNRAGGSLLDALETLFSATNGAISIYDNPLVGQMGRFIYRTHIAGSYFINFADAAPKVVPDPAVVAIYGRRIGDERLERFGEFVAEYSRLGEGFVEERFGSIARQLRKILMVQELTASAAQPPLIGDVWLPDVQVMASREHEGSTQGFYLAAKGGHNAENHNHNDVGNFIVYHDGEPVFIDVGPGEYTRTTFSSDRYTIWNFQSDYHSVPTIDGAMQQAGREFQATDVSYTSSERGASLDMELSAAYANSDAIERWHRTISLHRGSGSISIDDRYRLRVNSEPARSNLMTVRRAEMLEPGRVLLRDAAGGTDLVLEYDPQQAIAEAEVISLAEPRLRERWGPTITRLKIIARDVVESGALNVLIRRSE